MTVSERTGQGGEPVDASGLFDIGVQGNDLVFRAEKATLSSLAASLVALANAAGGRLLVGMDPKTGRPQGLENPERCRDRALRAALSTDPPLIIPVPRIVKVGECAVLVVNVPPGLPHVYSAGGRYLIREGSRDRALDPRQLRRLLVERDAVSFESQVPEGASLADLDWDQVESYLSALPAMPAPDREKALQRRGCLAIDAGELRPTYAGLLLFGRYPQQYVRSSGILVARYASVDMGDVFVKEEIRGTLPEQIRRAEAFVVSNSRKGVRLHGLARSEEHEYPAEAVREAIVNAVAHRDYRIRGDEIRILMFSDRVDFYSPGRLPGHVTVQNLVDERFSRNEVIVQVLSDMGYIERLGYGIDRMIRIMAEAGLKVPRFAETAAGFEVTFRGAGDLLLSSPTDSLRWQQLGLNERQISALVYLGENGRITSREYQELCPDVSAETIRRDLVAMVSESLLLKIGDKRGTYYIFK